MPGYWKRPISRMYSYNLDLGEHYYSPMTHYLDTERGTRGETPGALTFSERLAKKWLYGRRYGATDISDRYARASSVAGSEVAPSYLENEISDRYARAASEMRGASAMRASSQAVASRQQAMASQASRQQAMASQPKSSQAVSSQQAVQSSVKQAKTVRIQEQSTSTSESVRRAASSRKVEDDVLKKVADLHLMPWAAGKELEAAQTASARAKARIMDLERELEEITRKTMTSQAAALHTASALAKEAMMEDEANVASSYKKSRKVMIESAQKVKA